MSETEEKIIREGRGARSGYRIIKRGGKPYIQLLDEDTVRKEIDLYELIRLVDERGERWWVNESDSPVAHMIKALAIKPVLLWTEVPLSSKIVYVEKVEQIYTVCYKKKFYRVYALYGSLDVLLDWYIIITPVGEDTYCSYCQTEFC